MIDDTSITSRSALEALAISGGLMTAVGATVTAGARYNDHTNDDALLIAQIEANTIIPSCNRARRSGSAIHRMAARLRCSKFAEAARLAQSVIDLLDLSFNL